MLENFITVAGQVLVLFGLIAMGFILTKKNMITKQGADSCTNIALYLATPMVIIRSFIKMKFDPDTLKTLLISLGICLLIHIGYIFVSLLAFRGDNKARVRVLQFAIIFSNAGFMALPLQEALLGSEGVFFGTTYVVMFNIVVWSYGVILMSGDKKQMSVKKMLINPGIIGATIGVLLFVVSLPIPSALKETGYQIINHTTNLNTPIPMFVIGYYLATSEFKKAFKDKACYINLALRSLILPLATVFVLYLCGVRGAMLVSLAVASSAPTAAVTTMFSAKFKMDTQLSVNIVSLSTVISIITMPCVVAVAQLLA
jgi:predicted permease